MAESSRQSSSRKRAAEQDDSAEHSPIVQLSHAQLCGCDECWKCVDIRPSVYSPRLRAKRPAKCVTTLDRKREAPKNFFVYKAYDLARHLVFSADGLYLYSFKGDADLLVVDLQRNTRRLWRTPNKWLQRFSIERVAVLNHETILITTGGSEMLHLIRLPDDSEVYERTLLHSTTDRRPSFVLTDVTGAEVAVKRVVLPGWGRFVFFRLDLDELRATVQHTTDHPDLRRFVSQMSEDGTQLYTVDCGRPKELHVYSLDAQEWSKEELGGVDLNTFFTPCTGPKSLFAMESVEIDGHRSSFLSRCNFEAKKWEAIPFSLLPRGQLFPIVNSMDGKEDGLIVVEKARLNERFNNDCGNFVSRIKIERLMFRNPDSLRNLAVTVAHKSRELIDGEGGFQYEMNKPL